MVKNQETLKVAVKETRKMLIISGTRSFQ